MNTLIDTKLPPPVLLFLLCIAAWGLAYAFPMGQIRLPFQLILGGGSIVAGLALNLFPSVSLSKAKTTINPMRPSASEALVVGGLYRFTRNPMYLGHALILFGYTYFLGNALGFLVVPLYVGYITLFQIVPEERALSAKFGEQYADYRRRVRRWL